MKVVPLERGKISSRGDGKSVNETRKHAQKKFDAMRTKNQELVFGKMRKSDFASMDLYEYFAHYLAWESVKEQSVTGDKDGNKARLAIGTACGYFSGLINLVSLLDFTPEENDQRVIDFFLQWPPTKSDFPPWLVGIRHNMETIMTVECIKKGIPTVIRSCGIGREQLVQMMELLIKRGKFMERFMERLYRLPRKQHSNIAAYACIIV